MSAFGTARWADDEDLRRAGMLDATEGLTLGRLIDEYRPPRLASTLALFDPRVPSATACRQFLRAFRLAGQPEPNPLVRLPRAVHTAVFAPTGVGKGTSIVVPFLRSCPDSCVVLDLKGDNYRLTAEHRRNVFGHRVVALDPFRLVTGTPDKLNVLDFIDPNDPESLDEVRDIAEAIVVKNPNDRDPHWAEKSEVFVSAGTAAVLNFSDPDERSLQTVAAVLASPELLRDATSRLCHSDRWSGILARLGYELTHSAEREREGILSTANRFLRFLSTVTVAESTAASTFDPADLLGGRMTVYLVLPAHRMRSLSGLLRLWVTALMRAVVRGGIQERRKVHLVLDEAASLGHLEALDDAVDKYRAFGLRCLFLYQSLAQLKKTFPDGQEQTLLSNTSQIFFGINDNATADYVSAKLGDATILVAGGGTTVGTSRQVPDVLGGGNQASTSYSRSDTDNWQQQGRRLYKPEELQTLSERVAVCFTPGLPPIRTVLVRYYETDADKRPGRWRRAASAARRLVASAMLLVASVAGALFAADPPTLAPPARKGPAQKTAPATKPQFPREPQAAGGKSPPAR